MNILQNKKQCYFTGAETGLHNHHIFFGGKYNRKLSEKYGAMVWVKWDIHLYGIHGNRQNLNYALKKRAQKKIMEQQGWDTAQFIKVFGKNYLEDNND